MHYNYLIRECFVIRYIEIIVKSLEKYKLVSEIIDRDISILPALRASSYTRTRISVFSSDTMCARQEYTLLIVGGYERKRGKGKKRGRKKTWKRWGRVEKRDGERQEIQGIRDR